MWAAGTFLDGFDIANDIFRAWWFDPAIASLSFIIFMNLYWHYERKHSRTNDTSSAWAIGFSLKSRPDVQSALAYWAGIVAVKAAFGVVGVSLSPGEMWDGIPTTLSEGLYTVAEVVSGIVAYDAIFFFLHWAMHDIPALRWVHARHHYQLHQDATSSSTRATTMDEQLTLASKQERRQMPTSRVPVECYDVLRHSLLDGLLQVGVNILVQRHTPWGCVKSRFARLWHNVIVVWMLTESHTTSPYPMIWRNRTYFPGVYHHVAHHGSFTTHEHHNSEKQGGGRAALRYQQFFGYLDDLRIHYAVRRRGGGKQL